MTTDTLKFTESSVFAFVVIIRDNVNNLGMMNK